MPIPASINDLSITAGSNSPAGSESPSLIDDYLRTYASYIAQLRDGAQSNGFNYATAGGTANAITATYSPAVLALSDSTVLLVKAAALNTGATTFSPNGLTAKPIVDLSHTALQGGEIVANGEVCLRYNTSVGGGSWVLIYSSGVAVQPPTVVASARNVRMTVFSGATTATVTADEVILKTALGGYAKLLGSFSKVINLAITGAGGMDTGTATASGFLGIYAIYNPATQTSALLGKMESGAVLPAVYGGANMPSGYTYSALVSVAPISGTVGQFAEFFQIGNNIDYQGATVISGSGFTGSTIRGSAGIPYNAKFVSGINQVGSSAASAISQRINPTATGAVGGQVNTLNVAAGTSQAIPFRVAISTPQNVYQVAINSAGTPSFTIVVSNYEF